jgi:hypothetical protein
MQVQLSPWLVVGAFSGQAKLLFVVRIAGIIKMSPKPRLAAEWIWGWLKIG